MSIRFIPAAPSVEITVNGKTHVILAKDIVGREGAFAGQFDGYEGVDAYSRLILTLLRAPRAHSVGRSNFICWKSWRLYRQGGEILFTLIRYERGEGGVFKPVEDPMIVDPKPVFYGDRVALFSSFCRYCLFLAADVETLEILYSLLSDQPAI